MDMTRRRFVELSAIGAAASLAPALKASDISREGTKRPNILLMLGDDHRADVMGCMGNRIIQTPELDRLAQEGALFERHYCTTPICCTSRASIMLGQYASTHGIFDFAKPLSPEQVDRSYYGLLRQAGYYTGFLGKFGVGNQMPSKNFDVWKAFGGQGHYYPQGENGPHLSEILRDQAQDFIQHAPKGKPFCLSISFKAPHVQDEDPRQYLPAKDTLSLYKNDHIPPPIGAPESDINRFPLPFQRSESRRRWGIRFATSALYQESMKGYYRLISGADATIGAIRKTLEEQGVADNTIILYSADHGIFNAEHGFAGKWYAHEESIHIPLIVYDPRQPNAARGRRLRNTTLTIDLHPTLLELCGVSIPADTQGRSLVPQLSGEKQPDREVFFVEHHYPDHGFIPSSEAIRTNRWKYIRYTDNAAPFEELYDLHDDPHEVHNLARSPQHAKQFTTMRQYCTQWKRSFLSEKGHWTEPVTSADLQRDGLA